jgi:hypothetical protein
VSRAGVPLVLLALAVFLGMAFQTVQLVRASQMLATIDRSQDVPLQETMRLRQASDALASDIVQLAQSGNVAAKQVVDEMAKQNIAMHATPAAPATPPAPATPAPGH